MQYPSRAGCNPGRRTSVSRTTGTARPKVLPTTPSARHNPRGTASRSRSGISTQPAPRPTAHPSASKYPGAAARKAPLAYAA